MTARSGEGTWAAGPDRSWIRSVLSLIGPDFHDNRIQAPSQPVHPGWCATLALIIAAGLLLMAAGQGAGLRSDPSAARLFWSGVVVVVVPMVLRIAWPPIARSERLFLLVLLAVALFFIKISYAPTGFAGHDEFLHWIAADDMLTAGRLFLSNPLLPIGATYQGLEILTTGIVNLTGLSLFAQKLNIGFLMGLAFALAASAILPALLYSMYWRRFTTRGATWSIYGGLLSALLLVLLSPAVSGSPTALFPGMDFAVFPLKNPGLVSVPLAFVLGWLGSVGDRDEAGGAEFAETEVRALTGAGAGRV